MAAGATYTPIATQTVSVAATIVTFASINSSFTDLIIVANTTNSINTDTWIRFNGDSGTNYSSTYIRGDGTSALSGRRSSFNRILIEENGTGTNIDMTRVHVQNYTNTSVYKTIISRSDAASNGISAIAGLWRNTAAISQIDIGADSGTFAIGSTFTLYGISSA